MMNFVKRNTKTIVAVIITAVICISGTVYAVMSSKDISFTPSNSEFNVTNVEDALNFLYDKNVSSKLVLKMRTESYSYSDSGVTNYNLDVTSIPKDYNKFSLKLIQTSGSRECNTYGYNLNNGNFDLLQMNKEYSFDNYSNIWTTVKSNANGKMGFCVIESTFYN